MATRTSVSGAGPPPTDFSLLARLVLATFMVVDAADFPYRLIIGDGPEDVWGPGLHRLAGLVACLSLLWGWRRTLVVSTVVTAGFVVVRQEITGFELWWLPVAVALVVARGSRLGWGLVLVIGSALSAWIYDAHGGPALLGVAVLCLLGVVGGVGLGFVTRQRDAAVARIEALREENARLRRDERRMLAGDLRKATEGLFAHARRQSARSLAGNDPEELHRALHAVRDDARAALASLRQLLDVLRTPEPEAGVATPEERAAVGIRSARLAATVSLAGLAAASLLGAAPEGSPGDWVLAAALAAAALTCVRPAWGASASLVVLASVLVVDTSAWVVAVAVASAVAAAALAPLPTVVRVGVVAGVVVWFPPRLLVGGPDLLHDVAAAAGGTLGAVLVALALHDFLHTLRRSTSDKAQLASERADIKPGERVSLARELHDQLGHQLSIVALQVNAVEHVTDPARLRESLGRIDATLATAADELEALLAVMHAAPATTIQDGPLVTPSVVARMMSGKLAEHGHDTVLDVDAAADAIDPTSRLTLVRVLREATTNVLRHGAPASPVRGRIEVGSDTVELTIGSVVPRAGEPGRLPTLSTGYGLRGIRERVDVSGGTFAAGVVEGSWQVKVRLPVDAELVAAARGAGIG